MIDVMLRALRHPLDYIPVLNKRTLILQEIIQESEEIYSFIFKPLKPFTWKAGQHGIFHFPNKKIVGKGWRAFSIASCSYEGLVRISTIIKAEPSDFKTNLKAMRIGDILIMNGPFGEFHVSNKISHIVGTAGGIGITPFRALVKDIAFGIIADTKLTLIYSAVGDYTYNKELEILAHHPAIEIIYTRTPEEVTTALDEQIQQNGNSAYYFISGSPGMINAIRTSCINKGVKHIVHDSFKGY